MLADRVVKVSCPEAFHQSNHCGPTQLGICAQSATNLGTLRHSIIVTPPIAAQWMGQSVRINIDCRALGVRDGGDMIWFWIGSHAEYERLLVRM